MARPDGDGKIVCTGCERALPGTVEYFHQHRDAFKPKCKECRGGSFGVERLNRVMSVPDGKKVCNGCERVLPADAEHFHQTKKCDGFTSQCKECRQGGGEFGIHRPNRTLDIPDGKWMCKACGAVLPLNPRFFYQQDAGHGFDIRCKPCSAQRRNQARRKARNNVENDLTPSQWAAVKEVWAGGEQVCAYCGDPTPHPERDHVQPISDGGDTTAENIVPACMSCNRKKNDKTVSEWYPDAEVFDAERWEKIQSHLRGETQIPS